MEFLRTQKLGGYISMARIGLDDYAIRKEAIEELSDEPISPLTELSDDSPHASPIAVTSTIPEIENRRSRVAAFPSELKTPKVEDSADAFSLQPRKRKFDSTAENGPLPNTPTKSDSSALDQIRTPEISAAPKRGPCRPRKPRVTLILPVNPEPMPPLLQVASSSGHSIEDNGIEVKPDPAEEESKLRLVDAADTPENWLALPAIENKSEGGEMPVPIPSAEIHLSKPPLRRLPPIWAKARQEVCESFEWFRSYQGGVYQNNGSVKGYFLSAFSAKRDCFECDGKLIISHGGGKAESSRKERGQLISKAAEDQRADDSSVRALLENYRYGQPLVLLIDDKYGPFPFDLASQGVYMAVLGFYRIIHVWAEYQPSTSNASGRVVRYKFAFQWCEGQDEPWWSTQDRNSEDSCMADTTVGGNFNTSSNVTRLAVKTTDSKPDEAEPKMMAPVQIVTSPIKPDTLYFQCEACGNTSPHVFRQARTCLHPTCRLFWRMPSGDEFLPIDLDYNPEFLTVIDHRPLPFSFRGALAPKPPVPTPKDGVTTSYAYSRGWHCRKCGRLSCRSAWEHYQCPHCKDTQKIVGNLRPARNLMSIRPPMPEKQTFNDSVIDEFSGVVRFPMRTFNLSDRPGSVGQCLTFELPDKKGKIHLIKVNRVSNNEADRIFEAYQQQASDGELLFRRWPLRSHKLRGPLLTNYFSQNSGETYQYVGGTDNTVPFDRAPGAVVQARELIQKRIREALGLQQTFNEVLSAAYMEQQKMAFHSDSEKGLGPVVAGLSMGSPALMHFRLLLKYAPPNEQRTNALTVVLRHGDVLMMEGAGVQDFYEHTVVPCNFRIAATARWIDPGHV
ncbi:hypothetical protein K438DRAFT_1871990 [Mycena galopus ATCC 62051]|nr:hypothetical protein K438DRAFT_1871990 [Mycena galopus ATCC 62051]